MRLLITGDRNWAEPTVIRIAIQELWQRDKSLVVCAGGARGADTHAREACHLLGIPFTEFPAQWGIYGKAAGPIRNRQMLKEFLPTEVWAFHQNLEQSKGTKDMVNCAKKAGIPVNVISVTGKFDAGIVVK